jgi:hypothetical protein
VAAGVPLADTTVPATCCDFPSTLPDANCPRISFEFGWRQKARLDMGIDKYPQIEK